MKKLLILLCFPCIVYGKPFYSKLTQEQCLSLAVYKEARGENYAGKVAVINVILNRARNRNLSACRVVFQKHQFSWASTWKYNIKETQFFIPLVKSIVDKRRTKQYNPIKATHFHSKNMKRKPNWARKMMVVAVIGNHVFYKQKES